MTVPIPFGYNFKVNHKKMDNHYSMASINVYGNIYGVGYMISGDRMIITPDKTIVVHPGNIQFMHKNLYHRTTHVSDGIYENVDIKFNESVARHIISVIGQDKFEMLFDRININLTAEAIQHIDNIVKLIEYEWNNYDDYSDTLIENLLVQFFVTALRGQSISPALDTNIREKHPSLINALHYVQHFYALDPSLQQTADAIHISSAYLSRLFKSELDTSYTRFLTEVKLTHAMHLLINTNFSISEIASQCGYQNSNYFSDAFKKVIGISPIKYKKSVVNPDVNPYIPALPNIRKA